MGTVYSMSFVDVVGIPPCYVVAHNLVAAVATYDEFAVKNEGFTGPREEVHHIVQPVGFVSADGRQTMFGDRQKLPDTPADDEVYVNFVVRDGLVTVND